MRIALLLALLPALLFGGGPQRVVSQTVGTDDVLLALADPGQIAALSHNARNPNFSPHWKEAQQFPALRNPNAEEVLRFRPDLVLIASYTQAETRRLLEKSKVRLVVVEHFESLEELYANTRMIAKALGKEARAETLIRSWSDRVAALQKRLAGVKPVRLMAAGLYPFVAGSGTTFQDICDHAGAVNVASEAGLKGHAPMPTERAVRWKVDFLVGPKEDGADLAAKLKEIAPYKFMPVLHSGRLIQFPGSLFSATSHRRIDAYELLARTLHPERFK